MSTKRIVAAMSGGVDSTVAAYLLSKEGFEITGVTGKLLPDSCAEDSSQCCTAESAYAARRACDKLGARHITMNLVDEFRESVIARFVRSYQAGRTPNPCIDCNRFVKFDLFWRMAAAADCDLLATGHYARVEQDNLGKFRLMKGKDASKDQSYFLAVIPEDQLSRIKFPVGQLEKTNVREIAEEYGFRNANRPDSQDVCFLGKKMDFAELAQIAGIDVVAPSQGALKDETGAVRGEHPGIEYFTLGQRKGVGVGMQEPKYVYEIAPESGDVKVGPRDFKPYTSAKLVGCNWTATDLFGSADSFEWKLRYRSKPLSASIDFGEDGTALLKFAEPQFFVTPGQWAVAYLGDVVLGCGEIDSAS